MKFDDIERLTSWGTYSIQIEQNNFDSTLNEYKENYKLDPSPDSQRPHIQTIDKQIAYVEYILKVGRYSRDIIFNCSNWNTTGEGAMLLVDGRLEAVSLFLNNQLPIFNGHYLEDFSNKNNRRVPREYCFIFYINDLATRKEVLKFYLDLNNGGVVHTQSELDRVKSLLEEEIYKGYNA